MKRKKPSSSGVVDSPLDSRTQVKAREDGLPSVAEGRLRTYEPGDNVGRFLDLLAKRISRPLAVSMTACVHCGLCAESCHYFLARPDDPTMTPVWKADQIRKIFKRHVDWTGRIAPWWVKAGSVDGDEDLNRLKNIVFGTCSACRRCTYNCPMGVDTGLLVRFTRGLLTELGIVPEGVFNVSRDQWETGNQMAVTEEDYLETLAWMRDELRTELGTGRGRHPGRQAGLRCPLHDQSSGDQVRPPIHRPRGQDLPPGRRVLDHAEVGLGPDQLRALLGRRPAGRLCRPQRVRGGRAPAGEKDRHLGMRPRLSFDAVGRVHLGRIRSDPADRVGRRHGEALSRGGEDLGRPFPEHRTGDLPRFLQHRPVGRPRRGAARGPAARLCGFPRDVPQPPGELLLHGRRGPPVHGRIPAAAARGRDRSRPTSSGRPEPGWSARCVTIASTA